VVSLAVYNYVLLLFVVPRRERTAFPLLLFIPPVVLLIICCAVCWALTVVFGAGYVDAVRIHCSQCPLPSPPSASSLPGVGRNVRCGAMLPHPRMNGILFSCVATGDDCVRWVGVVEHQRCVHLRW